MQEATVLVNATLMELFHFKRRAEGTADQTVWLCQERAWTPATELEVAILQSALMELTKEGVPL
jgi:hypothetical protein